MQLIGKIYIIAYQAHSLYVFRYARKASSLIALRIANTALESIVSYCKQKPRENSTKFRKGSMLLL